MKFQSTYGLIGETAAEFSSENQCSSNAF